MFYGAGRVVASTFIIKCLSVMANLENRPHAWVVREEISRSGYFGQPWSDVIKCAFTESFFIFLF